MHLVVFIYSNRACLLGITLNSVFQFSNELIPVFSRLHSVFGTHLCWILIYVLLARAFNYGIGKYLPSFCPSFLVCYPTSACVHVDMFVVGFFLFYSSFLYFLRFESKNCKLPWNNLKVLTKNILGSGFGSEMPFHFHIASNGASFSLTSAKAKVNFPAGAVPAPVCPAGCLAGWCCWLLSTKYPPTSSISRSSFFPLTFTMP